MSNQHAVIENSYWGRTDPYMSQTMDKYKLTVLLPKVDRIWEFFYRNNIQRLIDDTTQKELLIKPIQNISFTLNQLLTPDLAHLLDKYPHDVKI